MNPEWHREFFTGVVVRSWVWDQVYPPEYTAKEIELFVRRFGLTPGRRVLDVHCGDGRHALELAAAGFGVTGLDISEEFIARGRERARQRELDVHWHCADSREPLPFEPFDAALCMGNAFGYLPADQMARFVGNIARSVRSGGGFLINMGMLAESILALMEERFWFRTPDMLMLFENHYVAEDSRLDTTCTFIENGREDVREFSHWVYTLGEIRRMLDAAGFTLREALGSTEGEPYRLRGREAYLVCDRK